MKNEQKSAILQSINNSDRKILLANVLEKAQNHQITGKFVYTNFLDLNELTFVIKYLNFFKFKYEVLKVNEYCEKSIIVFSMDYIKYPKKLDILRCVKIVPKSKGVLQHKDYMGSIYNLGIKREVLGDIFVNANYGLLICFTNIADYIKLNLSKVKNQFVQVEVLGILESKVNEFKINYIKKQVIINSLRVDIILSKVYKLSREEVKRKIEKGDLFINSKQIYSKNLELECENIVSLKRCGKFKVGDILGKTKSNNFVLQVYLYN